MRKISKVDSCSKKGCHGALRKSRYIEGKLFCSGGHWEEKDVGQEEPEQIEEKPEYCEIHPKYRALRRPRSGCKVCFDIYAKRWPERVEA